MDKSKINSLLLGLLTAVSISFYTLPTYANPADIPEDRQELRHDERDVHRDTRELRHDERKLARDERNGDWRAVREDRHEIYNDRRELHRDERDVHRDMRELRHDEHD